MLEPVSMSLVLGAAAKKIFEALTSRASGKVTDTIVAKLRGDPAKRAFKHSLANAVQRYATGERLRFAKPLLDKDGILANPEVAVEIAQLIRFEREPNTRLIGEHWKAAIAEPSTGHDFAEDAKILLTYLKEELRGTDIFRPVFDAQSLDEIAANTSISAEMLGDVEDRLASLAELVYSRFVEMTRLFSGASPQINSQIRDFTTFIENRTELFVGRQFVFAALDQFVQKESCGYFFIVGDPGIGKSSVAAHLVRSNGYIHHFNIRREGINTAKAFLLNVCAQLIVLHGLPYDVLPPEAAEDSGFLSKLLREVANRNDGQKTIVVIDGLDEADPGGLASGVNPLFLPSVLPSGVYICATMRKQTVAPYTDCRAEYFCIEHDSANNMSDIRAYVEQSLKRRGIQAYIRSQDIDAEIFVEHLSKKSEGNFMYLRHVLPELERGAYKGLTLNALPTGLRSYYEDHWKRMRRQDGEDIWYEYKLPIIMALAVVKKPVSIGLISDFAGVYKPALIADVLKEWSQFLHEEQYEYEGAIQKRYSVYHESFREFLAEREDIKVAHAKIVDVLWRMMHGNE